MNATKLRICCSLLGTVLILMSGCVSVQSQYDNARKSDTIFAYRAFLRDNPTGPLSVESHKRISELESESFEKAKVKDTIPAWQSFIAEASAAELIKEARQRISELREKEKQDVLELSRVWKASGGDSRAMTTLMSYCWENRLVREEVRGVMGEPAAIHSATPGTYKTNDDTTTYAEWSSAIKELLSKANEADRQKAYARLDPPMRDTFRDVLSENSVLATVLSQDSRMQEIGSAIYLGVTEWEYAVKPSQDNAEAGASSAHLEFNVLGTLISVKLENASGGYHQKRWTPQGLTQDWAN